MGLGLNTAGFYMCSHIGRALKSLTLRAQAEVLVLCVAGLGPFVIQSNQPVLIRDSRDSTPMRSVGHGIIRERRFVLGEAELIPCLDTFLQVHNVLKPCSCTVLASCFDESRSSRHGRALGLLGGPSELAPGHCWCGGDAACCLSVQHTLQMVSKGPCEQIGSIGGVAVGERFLVILLGLAETLVLGLLGGSFGTRQCFSSLSSSTPGLGASSDSRSVPGLGCGVGR